MTGGPELARWLRTGRLPRLIGLGLVFVGVWIDYAYDRLVEHARRSGT